jgi:transcription termination factor NusB
MSECLKPKQKTRQLTRIKKRIEALNKQKRKTESLKFKTLFRIANQIVYLRDSKPSILDNLRKNNPGRGAQFDQYIDQVSDKIDAHISKLESIYDNTEQNFDNKIDQIEKDIVAATNQETTIKNTPTC